MGGGLGDGGAAVLTYYRAMVEAEPSMPRSRVTVRVRGRGRVRIRVRVRVRFSSLSKARPRRVRSRPAWGLLV